MGIPLRGGLETATDGLGVVLDHEQVGAGHATRVAMLVFPVLDAAVFKTELSGELAL